MKRLQFSTFLDHKNRQAKKHLGIVHRMLKSSGFQIKEGMDENDGVFLFVYNPDQNLSFDGVRIYEIGGKLAYRIQREYATQPYGKAYAIDVDNLFEDLLGEDDLSDEEIGQEIINSVVSELKGFFDKSYEAEKKGPPVSDPLGKIHTRSTGTDYGNNVMNSGDH